MNTMLWLWARADTAEGTVKKNIAIINAVDIDPLKDVANMTSVTLEGKHKDKQAGD